MMKNRETDCWRCEHKRSVAGNSHIRCAKPDPFMTGDAHGIRNGWFLYPLLFDPIWKTRTCSNFSTVQEVA
jgi:hypothetical protein